MNPDTKKRLLVVVLFLSPMVAMGLAWLAHFMEWAPQGRTNRGVLVQPAINSVTLDLRAVVTPPIDTQDGDKKHPTWQLITVDDGQCEEACQKAVYLTRQINVALGKNKERVQHALWITGELDHASRELLKADTELHIANINQHKWQQQTFTGTTAQQAADRHYIFIVDPLGNLIMYYTDEQNPRDVLHDLTKTLLKYSSVG